MKCKLCKDTGWIGNFLCVCQTLLMKIFPIFFLFLFAQCADKGLEKAYAKQDLIVLVRKNQEKLTKNEAQFLLEHHMDEQEAYAAMQTCLGKWSDSPIDNFNLSVLYSRLENKRNTELIQKIQSYGNQ
jgi:hypothetical protein